MNTLLKKIRGVCYTDANFIIKQISGIVDYFSSENEKSEFVYLHESKSNLVCEDRVSYGDRQTVNKEMPRKVAEKGEM